MNDLPDDGATMFVGIPGCGKTYRAMEIHDSIPEYSVFFNTMNKDYSKSPRVRKLDDNAIKTLNTPPFKLTIDEDNPEAVARWVEFFEKVWDRKKFGPLRVWFDETDEFARCYSHDSPVERVFTKDRNRGILGVAICQSHSGQISAIIKKNCHCYFIWRLHPGEFQEYGKYYGLPDNLPIYPKDASPYYRYTVGTLYMVDRDRNETLITSATGEEEGEPEPDEDEEEDEVDEDAPAEEAKDVVPDKVEAKDGVPPVEEAKDENAK